MIEETQLKKKKPKRPKWSLPYQRDTGQKNVAWDHTTWNHSFMQALGKLRAFHSVKQPKKIQWLSVGFYIARKYAGSSLKVQWLGLHAFTAVALSSILVEGTKILANHVVWQKKKKEMMRRFYTHIIFLLIQRTHTLPSEAILFYKVN